MKGNNLKINLGCGKDYKKGYINCDISRDVGADLVFDMNKFPWPFRNGSVEEVIMFHVLEHFHEPIKILKEIFRICKNKVIVKIRVPYFSSESAFSMLDHYHQFSWTSFDALDRNHPCHWQSVGNFKIMRKKLIGRKKYNFFFF